MNDSSKGVILSVDKKNIAKNTAKIEIDKNKYPFCQKHSGCIFASGKSSSTPLLYNNVIKNKQPRALQMA